MKTITLEIREDSCMYDKNGLMVSWINQNAGYISVESHKDSDIESIIKLKQSGFSSDEIIRMKDKGIL